MIWEGGRQEVSSDQRSSKKIGSTAGRSQRYINSDPLSPLHNTLLDCLSLTFATTDSWHYFTSTCRVSSCPQHRETVRSSEAVLKGCSTERVLLWLMFSPRHLKYLDYLAWFLGCPEHLLLDHFNLDLICLISPAGLCWLVLRTLISV